MADERKRILVVEDDATISDILVVLLNSEGYEATPARDGALALQLARAQPPDLITLDLALPGRDGVDVLHELKREERTRSIPVIVISAYTGRLRGEDRRSVASVVDKPFDIDELLDTVQRVLDRSRGVRQE